jgi:hypothetical protein
VLGRRATTIDAAVLRVAGNPPMAAAMAILTALSLVIADAGISNLATSPNQLGGRETVEDRLSSATIWSAPGFLVCLLVATLLLWHLCSRPTDAAMPASFAPAARREHRRLVLVARVAMWALALSLIAAAAAIVTVIIDLHPDARTFSASYDRVRSIDLACATAVLCAATGAIALSVRDTCSRRSSALDGNDADVQACGQ